MSEDGADERSIETGDVLMMGESVISFILLVTSRATHENPDPKYGARMTVCWLDHPDPEKVGHSDWLWEGTLRDKSVWRKLASAA